MRALHITGLASWASYLINGDASGLTLRETRQADRWLANTGLGAPCGIVEDSERFTNALHLFAPEQDYRAGEACDFIFLTP